MTITLDVKNLRETETVQSTGDLKVDREAGVIYGVKIIGPTSVNGRVYSDKALEQAVELYEEADVNIDHVLPDDEGKDRSLNDKFGQLTNVRRTSEGVFGDLHYLKSHPMAERVCEMAERMPKKLGLSHDAQGQVDSTKKPEVVETIEAVRSVDLVSKPATNVGLFESENPRTKKDEEAAMAKKTFRTLLKEAVAADKRTLSKRGLKALMLLESDGMLDPDEPITVSADSNPVDVVKDTIVAKVAEVIKDDGISADDTKNKVGALVDSLETVKAELAGEVQEEDDEEEEETTKPVSEMEDEEEKDLEEQDETDDEEGKTVTECGDGYDKMHESAKPKKSDKKLTALQEEVNQLKEKTRQQEAKSKRQELRESARDLCDKYGVYADSDLLDSLSQMADKKAVENVVKAMPTGPGRTRQQPRSQSFQESRDRNNGSEIKDVKEFANSMRGM